jgi:hypothetical protein
VTGFGATIPGGNGTGPNGNLRRAADWSRAGFAWGDAFAPGGREMADTRQGAHEDDALEGAMHEFQARQR